MHIFMKPGELYVLETPAVISTILGSCVAVTIFNRRLKVGGICHALLPMCPANNGHERFRYVDSAVAYMLRKFGQIGVRRDEMEVKLLGGADVLDRTNGSAISVGQKNVESALEIMRNEDIRLAVSDVGGKLGRKVHFYTDTGRVLLKRIKGIPLIGIPE